MVLAIALLVVFTGIVLAIAASENDSALVALAGIVFVSAIAVAGLTFASIDILEALSMSFLAGGMAFQWNEWETNEDAAKDKIDFCKRARSFGVPMQVAMDIWHATRRNLPLTESEQWIVWAIQNGEDL